MTKGSQGRDIIICDHLSAGGPRNGGGKLDSPACRVGSCAALGLSRVARQPWPLFAPRIGSTKNGSRGWDKVVRWVADERVRNGHCAQRPANSEAGMTLPGLGRALHARPIAMSILVFMYAVTEHVKNGRMSLHACFSDDPPARGHVLTVIRTVAGLGGSGYFYMRGSGTADNQCCACIIDMGT